MFLLRKCLLILLPSPLTPSCFLLFKMLKKKYWKVFQIFYESCHGRSIFRRILHARILVISNNLSWKIFCKWKFSTMELIDSKQFLFIKLIEFTEIHQNGTDKSGISKEILFKNWQNQNFRINIKKLIKNGSRTTKMRYKAMRIFS